VSGLTHRIFEAILSDWADARENDHDFLTPSVKSSISLFSFLCISSKSGGSGRIDSYINVDAPEYLDLDGPERVRACLDNIE